MLNNDQQARVDEASKKYEDVKKEHAASGEWNPEQERVVEKARTNYFDVLAEVLFELLD